MAPSDHRTRFSPVVILIVVCFLAFFTRLGASKLWDRDEPRNARCAVEMLERNDWIVPTFNDELRTHKPILLYWLMMSAFAVFGENEFAARFWSATLSTGTVGVTYLLGKHLFDQRTAFWGSIVLATTLMFTVAARAATPDATLIFFSTLSIAAFARSTSFDTFRLTSRKSARRYTWLGAIAMAMAVLAKGPVGCVLPAAVWGCFLVFRRLPTNGQVTSTNDAGGWSTFGQQRLLELRNRLSPKRLAVVAQQLSVFKCLTALVLIALPWYLLVGLKTDGVWLREFFLDHNVGRALQTMEGHDGNSLFYYPIAILAGFFPWSMFAVPVALWTWWQCRGNAPDAFRFLLIWVGVYVAAFSMASTKLPSYVTPTYPAIALIVGHLLAHGSTTTERSLRTWASAAAGCLALSGLIFVLATPWAIRDQLPLGDQPWWNNDLRLACIGFLLLIGGAVSWRRFAEGRWQQGCGTFAITATVWTIALFAIASPSISRHQSFTTLTTAEQFQQAQQIGSLAIHEPSWIFYARRSIPFLNVDRVDEVARILSSPTGRIITSPSVFAQQRDQLPAGTRIVAEVPYFLKQDRLLLLGVPENRVAATPGTRRVGQDSHH